MTLAFLFAFLFTLLIVGVPIGISLGLATLTTFYFFVDMPIFMVAQRLYYNIAHFPLMAVVFFILAGHIAQKGGVARRLIDLANALVGSFPGGLALTGTLACVFFASLSGSSSATVAAIGSIMIPGMLAAGYPKRFAVGSVATAGSLGILIPPSIPLIIYAFVTDTSIARLFIAAILPGIFFGVCLLLVSYGYAVRTGLRGIGRTTLREKGKALKEAVWSLMLPVLIIVGIYGFPSFSIGSLEVEGTAIFTPTEAAVVAVIYSFVIGRFVYKEFTWPQVPRIIVDAVGIIAMLLFLVANAILFGFLLTFEQVPQNVADWILAQNMSPWIFLLLVNFILFLAGDFMDAIPIIMIFIPALFPAALALGIDPIHFGIMVVINMELGTITPPVGVNLYVASGIAKMPLHQVIVAAAPWMFVVIFVLLVVTYVPAMSTFLPDLLYGLQR